MWPGFCPKLMFASFPSPVEPALRRAGVARSPRLNSHEPQRLIEPALDARRARTRVTRIPRGSGPPSSLARPWSAGSPCSTGLREPPSSSRAPAASPQTRSEAAEQIGAPQPSDVDGAPADAEPKTALVEYTTGLAVGQLLCYGQEWVSRRTETFQFTSATTVRRQMAVDFALPRVADAEATLDVRAVREMVDGSGPTYVPLTTLRKAPLTAFDLFDEEQRTLPLLTTEENGRIAGDALAILALGLRAEQALEPFPASVIQALKSVAQLPSARARRLLACLTDGTAEEWASIQTLAPPPNGAVDMREPDDQVLYARALALRNLEANHADVAAKARALMREEPLRALARKLASDFAVLVPLEGDVFRRRIIKLAYQEPIAHRGDYKQRRWWNRARRACVERLSWSPKTFAFSRIAAGDAEGHHVELVAPEDMEIVRASFTAYVPKGKAADTEAPAAPAVEQPDAEVAEALGADLAELRPAERLVLRKPENPLRAHMNLRKLPPQAYATARVQLRASPSGLLNAATFVAVLIVGVLWWGSYRANSISQADAAAAILLAAPTLLAAYIARPGEHELVGVALSGVRLLIAMAGLLMFVAAASLAFGYADEQLGNTWCVLRWAALAPAAGLLWASVRVRWPRFPRNLAEWLRRKALHLASKARGRLSRKRRAVRKQE